MYEIICGISGLFLGWKMVRIERAGWRQTWYFIILLIISIGSMWVGYVTDSQSFELGLLVGLFSFCTLVSYLFFRFTDWVDEGSRIDEEIRVKRPEKQIRARKEKPVQVNVTNVRNEYNTTVNVYNINFNVALNILKIEPGFGKRELKRARKARMTEVRVERKQIGFFDKAGKLENKNKRERVDQAYRNLLEHVK